MPPVYKDATYDSAALWCEDTAIQYGPNRKRNPSKSYDRYEIYKHAKTMGEALKLGSKWQDLFFDYEHGMLHVVGPPFRPAPMDLTKVLPADATPFEREMAKSVSRANLTKRTEVVAERLGIDKKELGNDREDGETLEMHGQRTEALTEAKSILESAERENRKVTDEEVRLVLSKWAFKNNDTRQNVLPEGQRFVKSDTLGLIPLRDGTVQVTKMTKEYPEVTQLLCKWLKDHTPEDLQEDHVFTSINVNCGYAAKLHRDAGNVGPSMIKAFGKFTGGRLRYWPEDDQSTRLEEVRKQPSVDCDLTNNLCMFNGGSAHEVEPFEGERFTLVYFSVSKFPRADVDSRKACIDCGINMPTEESMERAKRILRPPRGYAVSGTRPLSMCVADSWKPVRLWQILDGGAGPARSLSASQQAGHSGRGADSPASPEVLRPTDTQESHHSVAKAALAARLLSSEAVQVIDVEDTEPVMTLTPGKRSFPSEEEPSATKRPRAQEAKDVTVTDKAKPVVGAKQQGIALFLKAKNVGQAC